MPIILRPGFITSEAIELILNLKLSNNVLQKKNIRLKVSGQSLTHYSPKAKVVLGKLPELSDGFFAMADVPTPTGSIRLGSPNNIDEFARDMYLALRLADAKNIQRISVIPPLGPGLAVAIRDRLEKAAGNKS